MRVFTDQEKEILKRIQQKKGGNLYYLIGPWISDVSFYIDLENTAVQVRFEGAKGY